MEQQTYRALSPLGLASDKRDVPLSSPLANLSGKTIAAMRHLFRADETFPMLETMFKERFPGVRWVSNHDMPDERIATPRDEEALATVLRDRECDVLLVGNAN